MGGGERLRHMRRDRLLYILWAGIGIMLVAASMPATRSGVVTSDLPLRVEISDNYPTLDEITFYDLNHETLKGEDFLGDAVLLAFFDPNCSKCTRKLPVLEKIRETFEEEGIRLIALPTSGSETGMAYLAQRHDWDWFWGRGPKELRSLLRCSSNFEIILFNRLGEVAFRVDPKRPNWTYYLQLGLGAILERTVDLGHGSREFIGSIECGFCHIDEYKQWRDTPHAHSFETLRKTSDHLSRECRECHLTGLAGNERRTERVIPRQRLEVGCEECHGPGGPHRREDHELAGLYSTAEKSCVRCHDAKNSPDWDYADYLKKVKH